jgi:chaperonin GroES
MNYTKIRPLMNRVLVKKLQQPTKTTGGILLPEKNTSNQKVGMITDIGAGRHLHNGSFVKPSLKPGDYVLLPDYGGVRVPKKPDSEEEYYIYQEDDILGVVNDNLNDKI